MPRPRFSMRIRLSAWGLLIIALVVLVYWPGLGSFLVRDDFAQLAYPRLLGTPWPLFVHQHFIPGDAFFRPLGFAWLWLAAAIAGTSLTLLYSVQLALHGLVCLALLGLLRRLLGTPWLAGLLTLVFALNPLAIGTSLWLADCFDLLTALTALLALSVAWDYRERGGSWRLLCAMVLIMLAMLAKETGLVLLAPVTLLWLDWRRWRVQLAVRWWALLAAWAVLPMYLGWRMAVLGSLGGGSLFRAQSPLDLLWRGGQAWTLHLPAYLSFWPRLASWQQVLLVTALVLLVVALLGAWRKADPARHKALPCWALAGLALFAAPGAVQSAVASVSARALTADMSPVMAVMQSRLYYVALCGLVLMIGAALAGTGTGTGAGTRSGTGTRWHKLQAAALALLVLVSATAAHQLAGNYAARSQAIRPLADAAVQAVARLPLPKASCQIYFLNVQRPPEWGRFSSMDSIVKALTPDLDRVDNCFIQTTATPWFYLLRRGTMAHSSVAPLEPLPGELAHAALLSIGDLEVTALNLSPAVDARDIRNAFFLAWRDGRFVNVTAAVRSGALPVHFQCIRAPIQCPPAPGKETGVSTNRR